MRKTLLLGAVILVIVATAPASSQIWVGQIVGNIAAAAQAEKQEHDCMMGQPMPQAEIDETRPTVMASMAHYIAAVASGGPADVRSAWFGDDSSWFNGATTVQGNGLRSIIDPFVAAGARIDPTPQTYLRSGDGKLVSARWVAGDAAGQVVGVYDGIFRRQLNIWKLRSLTLNRAAGAGAPFAQFCHKPFDVEPYKVSWEAKQRRIEAKRAAKAARRAAEEARHISAN